MYYHPAWGVFTPIKLQLNTHGVSGRVHVTSDSGLGRGLLLEVQ